MAKGKFDLDDLADQLRQMSKMGGMGGLMGMMPGMGKMKDQMAAAGLDDKMFKRQIAIITSMTKAERANPDILKHSRKKRIAAGSGTDAAEINKLLKMHRGMADMMKAMGGKGKGRHDALDDGRPRQQDGPRRPDGRRHARPFQHGPEAAEALQKQAAAAGVKLPAGGLPNGLPGGLPGLPGGGFRVCRGHEAAGSRRAGRSSRTRQEEMRMR
jgi:signal recognition particle subunit SRP54